MAYNTKAIKTDKDGNPISQYYNSETDEYEPVEGAAGGNKVILYNEDGTPNNSLSLGEILDKLDQLTGTVIAEQYRQQNEAIRQQNEQDRIDLYNALKDLDVSQYELRLQNVENQVNIDNFLLEEWDEPVIPLPSNATNGQINEIKIFGNTEVEEDNVKSTFGAIRLKSVGKNLLNIKNTYAKASGYIITDTGYIRSAGQTGNIQYILEVEKDAYYTVSRKILQGNSRITVIDFYTNEYLVSYNSSSTCTFKATSDKVILIFDTASIYVNAITEVTDIQVEKGTQATEYEPYKESTLYVIAKDEEGNILELRSLPNGTKDEINVANRKLIKQIGEKANVSSGTVINFTDMAEGGTYFAWNENGETETGNKGDTLGIDATVLIYQLAEPEIIPVQITGSLQAYENGTMYIDAIIPRIDFYDINGIAVDVPIGTIDTLYKVDKETGYLYSLDISQAEISQDRLSFIHPDLVEGDLVDWDYEPALESTSPGISMKLPTNIKASVNSLLDAENRNRKDIEWNKIKLGLLDDEFNEHIENKDNPHNITPDQIGALKQEDFNIHLSENSGKHITESGENVNGRYIKFDDGTMICTHSIEVGSRITNGAGTSDNLYRTSLATWTFPAAFATTPIISGTGMIAGNSAMTRANTFNFSDASTTRANNLQLVMLSNDSTDAICTIHVIAIGRWK